MKVTVRAALVLSHIDNTVGAACLLGVGGRKVPFSPVSAHADSV
ncbi:Uncharacterised protein [Budvicia aquatica]|uniref:Uncharacterized protein n=1 Tax=Budvicia aquatica TaxID=82979 RepID=A0A484ZPZ0_9GAMM|nr:Uncharacterised protein [Budvicia aquatica]